MSKLVCKALEVIPAFQQPWVDIEVPIELSPFQPTIARFSMEGYTN
ncbi:MAG: hypothetical protein OXU23_14385 [Candidatus Poribacteria bacterium]|nr:hypothetical protein [Candidatus Poribacteria bacterium]